LLSRRHKALVTATGESKICRRLGASKVHSERVLLHWWHADGHSFARSLRAIGADQPRAGHLPVNLKPVLRLQDKGCDADDEIGFFYIE
jgi:hypothetical protein